MCIAAGRVQGGDVVLTVAFARSFVRPSVLQADAVRDVPAGPRRACEEVPARQLGPGEARCVLAQHSAPVSDSLGSLIPSCSRLLDIPLNVSDAMQLDGYLGRGLQPGEVELPNEQPGQ